MRISTFCTLALLSAGAWAGEQDVDKLSAEVTSLRQTVNEARMARNTACADTDAGRPVAAEMAIACDEANHRLLQYEDMLRQATVQFESAASQPVNHARTAQQLYEDCMLVAHSFASRHACDRQRSAAARPDADTGDDGSLNIGP